MLHSHTQFCDGHASMEEMALAAHSAKMERFGFSPHSPIPIPSPCNMKENDVPAYLAEADRLKELYKGKMSILKGMEVDFISSAWGPHSIYFKDLPLDFRIGSVHFVKNQKGKFIDCDGSPQRFVKNLHDCFNSDLDYIVEKYFDSVREMICLGGFDILGHFDKIAANASFVRHDIEYSDRYYYTIQDVIKEATEANLTIEINTKAFLRKQRFFPSILWWDILKKSGAGIIINSDAHNPLLIDAAINTAKHLFYSFGDRKIKPVPKKY